LHHDSEVAMNQKSTDEQRLGPDPRREPTSVWDAVLGGGQRMVHRRAEDHEHPYFVDRFSTTALALCLALLTFTFLDGVLTLELVDVNCAELNPAMRYLLSKGPLPFLLGKYILTAAGLPVLLTFKNHRFFHTSFRVGYLIPVFVLSYIALIGYQIQLLQTLQGGP
jgi:hypothetical protein